MRVSFKTIKYKTVPDNIGNRAIGYRIYRACGLVLLMRARMLERERAGDRDM